MGAVEGVAWVVVEEDGGGLLEDMAEDLRELPSKKIWIWRERGSGLSVVLYEHHVV